MSNLTLLLRFLCLDSCNAAICIQMYDLLMSRRGTDWHTDRRMDGVTRHIKHSITQRSKKHQNRAINYIIVHRVSGSGHSHEWLPVKLWNRQRGKEEGGRREGQVESGALQSGCRTWHWHQQQQQQQSNSNINTSSSCCFCCCSCSSIVVKFLSRSCSTVNHSNNHRQQERNKEDFIPCI